MTQKVRRKPGARTSRELARASQETSIFDRYMADVAKHPILTPEEEFAVGKLAMEGDLDAQEKLVNSNLRFVVHHVRKITNTDVDQMDLINAGNMGLMHAAKKYDPTRGVRFVGYAYHWVRQYIQKEIDTHGQQMRTSVTQLTLNRRVRRLNETARRTLGREYSVEELAEMTGRHPDRIREALDYCVIPRSLDEPLDSDDGGSMTLAQVIGDEEHQREKERNKDLRDLIKKILDDVLTARERMIITNHFGLSGNREQSLQEIGLMLGITRERVRQLCRKALKKILDASQYREEIYEFFAPNPDHEEGTFLINSRKRSPLPPGQTKESYRAALLEQARR